MNKKNRQTTPDIMSSLMIAGNPESSEALKHEKPKAVEQESNKVRAAQNVTHEGLHESNKGIKRESNKAVEVGAKEKTTFNLSLGTLEELEDAWILLRRKFKGVQRITKTLIVEEAIKVALRDLDSRSELSDLYKRLKEESAR